MNVSRTRRLLLAGALLSSSLSALAMLPAPDAKIARWSNAALNLSAQLVEVSVVEYDSWQPYPVFASPQVGRGHVGGSKGEAYRIKVRNKTPGRLLVVPSVDGVNAITGKTASPQQSGYLIAPYGEVVIDGWRKSMDEVAKFVFSAPSGSYASQTGRPDNVGVIGLAVFEEMKPPSQWNDREPRLWRHQSNPVPGGIGAPVPPAAPAAAAENSAAADVRVQKAQRMATEPSLGTGHGERDVSRATRAEFQRATLDPVEIVSLNYDSLVNLERRGIAQRRPVAPTRDPFPGGGFVADPPR